MLDLLLRKANLPDGRRGIDIAIKDGRIAEVGPASRLRRAREIDATGRLVTPPFVDAHFHLDSDAHPRPATGGTRAARSSRASSSGRS